MAEEKLNAFPVPDFLSCLDTCLSIKKALLEGVLFTVNIKENSRTKENSPFLSYQGGMIQ